jgi:hypothetical protein
MREARTADEFKAAVEQALGGRGFVEIVMDPVYEVQARVASNPVISHQLKQEADAVMKDLRERYVLSIRRAEAQAAIRDELRHPAASVQLVGDSAANYRVEVRGGGLEAQRSAESIFARLKRMYEIV